jgi:hypothetical protein
LIFQTRTLDFSLRADLMTRDHGGLKGIGEEKFVHFPLNPLQSHHNLLVTKSTIILPTKSATYDILIAIMKMLVYRLKTT